jgi:hypothetical protein
MSSLLGGLHLSSLEPLASKKFTELLNIDLLLHGAPVNVGSLWEESSL